MEFFTKDGKIFLKAIDGEVEIKQSFIDGLTMAEENISKSIKYAENKNWKISDVPKELNSVVKIDMFYEYLLKCVETEKEGKEIVTALAPLLLSEAKADIKNPLKKELREVNEYLEQKLNQVLEFLKAIPSQQNETQKEKLLMEKNKFHQREATIHLLKLKFKIDSEFYVTNGDKLKYVPENKHSLDYIGKVFNKVYNKKIKTEKSIGGFIEREIATSEEHKEMIGKQNAYYYDLLFEWIKFLNHKRATLQQTNISFLEKEKVRIIERLKQEDVQAESDRIKYFNAYIDSKYNYSPTIQDFEEELDVKKRIKNQNEYLDFLRETKKIYSNANSYYTIWGARGTGVDRGELYTDILKLINKEIGNSLQIHPKKIKVGKLSAPVIASFCSLVNQGNIIPKGEETVEVYCKKICEKFQLIYTDRVRQNFAENVTSKNTKKVKALILPKIEVEIKNQITKYLDTKETTKQKLYA